MIKNKGVILGRRDTDYVGGTIPHEILNPSGDWRIYLPEEEHQKRFQLETMGCVTFSALNIVEMMHKFYYREEVNYSDRYLAKKSGTTKEGNFLWKVADTLRKCGVCLEEDWRWPEFAPNMSNDDKWNLFYASIPEEVDAKAIKFLDKWDVRYEWVDTSRDSLEFHIKHAPLQIVINQGTHAVVDIFSKDDIETYFDTYKPFVKTADSLTWAMKIVLTPKYMLTKSDVIKLQSLEGYKDPDGIAYWGAGDKTITQYLDARLPDKKQDIENALSTE